MGGEVDFSQVRNIIYECQRRGFYISGVTYDGFASEESIQQLRKRGMNAEELSVDKTMLPYETLKEAILERLTAEEKRRFIRIAYKRIKQLEAAQAVEGKESRLPEGVEEAGGVEDEVDDSGPD